MTEKKYNDIQFLKHYYNKLYVMLEKLLKKGDYESADKFVEGNLSPLHEEFIADNIEDEVAKLNKLPIQSFNISEGSTFLQFLVIEV